MSTLYIDVDDTLVLWVDAVEGRLVTEWEANADGYRVVASRRAVRNAGHPEELK